MGEGGVRKSVLILRPIAPAQLLQYSPPTADADHGRFDPKPISAPVSKWRSTETSDRRAKKIPIGNSDRQALSRHDET